MKITEAILYVAYKEGPISKNELTKKVMELLGIRGKRKEILIKAWIGKLVKHGKSRKKGLEVNVDGKKLNLKLVEDNGKYKAIEV